MRTNIRYYCWLSTYRSNGRGAGLMYTFTQVINYLYTMEQLIKKKAMHTSGLQHALAATVCCATCGTLASLGEDIYSLFDGLDVGFSVPLHCECRVWLGTTLPLYEPSCVGDLTFKCACYIQSLIRTEVLTTLPANELLMKVLEY